MALVRFDLICPNAVFRRTQRAWYRRSDDPGLASSSRRAHAPCGTRSEPLRHMRRRRSRRVPQEGSLMGHARDSYGSRSLPLGASGIGPAAAAQPGQHSAGATPSGPHEEISAWCRVVALALAARPRVGGHSLVTTQTRLNSDAALVPAHRAQAPALRSLTNVSHFRSACGFLQKTAATLPCAG